MSRAVVLGELCLDIIAYEPRSIPVMGSPTWAEHIEIRLGGSATYAAQALRALGVDVRLSGVVGEDPVSDEWLRRLGEEGIHTHDVRRQAGQPMPKCIAVCKGGSKRFVACSSFPPYLLEGLEESLAGVDLVYFGGYLLYPELWNGSLTGLFKQARDRQALVALDTQLLPVPPELFRDKALSPHTLGYVDVLFASQKEATALTGHAEPVAAARQLASFGPRVVVVKQGGAGCLTWSQNNCVRSGGRAVSVRAPVGAGDFFGAAFAYGLLQGWDLEKVSGFANAFAGLAISRMRGRGLPPPGEALALSNGSRV
jgi:sugar/nucleoside kinase (ribokinase family)